MSKLSNADATLRAIYNYNESGRAAEFKDMVEEAQGDDSEASPFMSTEADDKAEQMAADEEQKVAQSAGLSTEDFTKAMRWLSTRELIFGSSWSVFFDVSTPSLTVEGEDLIDLGLTVEQWYHGHYRRSRYGEGITATEEDHESD